MLRIAVTVDGPAGYGRCRVVAVMVLVYSLAARRVPDIFSARTGSPGGGGVRGRGGPALLEPDCALEKRRVVITGLGAVTPLGNSRQAFWEGLVAGRSGVAPTTAFDASKLTTRIAAEVKDFDPDALIGRREARRMDRYAQFALVAAREAIADANLPEDPDVRRRTGAIVASGIGGIITVENTTFEVGPQQKWDRISPFFVPMLMANAASAHISMSYGLRGPVFAVASACASANDAFTVAYDKIVLGRGGSRSSTGGSEATVIPTAMGGFCSMKAMSTRNDDPDARVAAVRQRARRLRARRRRRRSSCSRSASSRSRAARASTREVLGYGQSADAYHIAQPDPESKGVILAMERALEHSGRRARASRVHQRARHVDAARRSRRVAGDRARLRRARDERQARGVVDEVDARAPARRGRRDRRDRDGARAARRHHAADDQLRSPRSRVHARLRAERRAQSAGRRRDVERLRFRRPQHDGRLRHDTS